MTRKIMTGPETLEAIAQSDLSEENKRWLSRFVRKFIGLTFRTYDDTYLEEFEGYYEVAVPLWLKHILKTMGFLHAKKEIYVQFKQVESNPNYYLDGGWFVGVLPGGIGEDTFMKTDKYQAILIFTEELEEEVVEGENNIAHVSWFEDEDDFERLRRMIEEAGGTLSRKEGPDERVYHFRTDTFQSIYNKRGDFADAFTEVFDSYAQMLSMIARVRIDGVLYEEELLEP